MWYSSIFGNRRYKWIYKELSNFCVIHYCGSKEENEKKYEKIYNKIYKILRTWDPRESKELEHLYDTINMIRKDNPIFSQTIICRCIIDLDNSRVFDNYYTAWSIIGLMSNRMIPIEKDYYYDSLLLVGTKYMLWKNMEKIVEFLPRIFDGVDPNAIYECINENKKTIHPQTMLKEIDPRERLWNILYIMITAYNKIHTKTTEHEFSCKLQLYLQLLEPNVISSQEISMIDGDDGDGISVNTQKRV